MSEVGEEGYPLHEASDKENPRSRGWQTRLPKIFCRQIFTDSSAAATFVILRTALFAGRRTYALAGSACGLRRVRRSFVGSLWLRGRPPQDDKATALHQLRKCFRIERSPARCRSSR